MWERDKDDETDGEDEEIERGKGSEGRERERERERETDREGKRVCLARSLVEALMAEEAVIKNNNCLSHTKNLAASTLCSYLLLSTLDSSHLLS